MVTRNSHIVQPKNLRSKSFLRGEAWTGFLFTVPAILGFLLFNLIPIISSAYFSLTSYNIVTPPQFVGLDNYVTMFSGSDPFFYKSLGLTTYYTLLSVPLSIVFSFLVALLMNQKLIGLPLFRTIFYLPSIVPVVATSMVWLWLLDPSMGLLNVSLRSLGLPTSKWIFGEQTVIPSLAVMSLWSRGNVMILFLAALKDVPTTYYEAAEIDGAGAFKRVWYITIPLLSPIIFLNLVTGLINAFQTFAQAFIMTQGGPNNRSLFYVYYLFREGFQYSKMGFACAIAMVLFVIITILTAILFKTSNNWV